MQKISVKTEAILHFVIFHQRFCGIFLKKQYRRQRGGGGPPPLGMVTGWERLFSVAINLLNPPSELLFL